MPIRDATYADLVPGSKILADAFKDEALFGRLLHPHQDKYPNEMYLYFLRWLRPAYLNGENQHLIVSYKADSTGKEECITGIALWLRQDSNAPKPGLYAKAVEKAINGYQYLEAFVYPNRALEPSRSNVLASMERFTKHHWTGTRADHWFLSIIGVSPQHEKQGYGRELVKYGFDKAKEDGWVCSVISAPGRENFYRACGFDVQDGKISDEGGDENPLKDILGGAIFFWDNSKEPEGIKKYGEV